MADSLTTRVGRLISGSFSALVDAVENASPEIVLEQAVRELDGAVDDIREDLGRIVANKHLATKRLAEKNGQHEDLSKKIEIALKENREDLAEAAVSSQLDIEAQIPVLENTISECSDQEKELNGYISALHAKKREMQEDLRAFVASRGDASSPPSSGVTNPTAGAKGSAAAEKAVSAFDRVLEKHTGLSGPGNMDLSNAQDLVELEKLSRQNRIRERLTAIKSGRSTEA